MSEACYTFDDCRCFEEAIQRDFWCYCIANHSGSFGRYRPDDLCSAPTYLYTYTKQTNKVSTNNGGNPGTLLYQWSTTTSINYNTYIGSATPGTYNTGTLPPDDLMAHLLSQVYQTENRVIQDTQTDYVAYQKWQSNPGTSYDVISEQFNEEHYSKIYTVADCRADHDALLVDYEYLANVARNNPGIKCIVRRYAGNGEVVTDLYQTVPHDIAEARPTDYFGDGKIVYVQALRNWTGNNILTARNQLWVAGVIEGRWESIVSIKSRTQPKNYWTKQWEQCGSYGPWSEIPDSRIGDVFYSVSTPGVQAVEHSG